MPADHADLATDVFGGRYGADVRDHKLMAAAKLKTAEISNLDYVSTISSPARKAADHGANVQ